MAKATINTGSDAQPVHTRTTSDSAESQVSVLGIDGSDSVVPATATFGLSTTDGGTYGYASGTSAATVDVPSGARVKRVSVLAGAGSATVTIAAGNTITIPAGGSFDEQIPGQAPAGADVVIGGSVSTYYVSWVG